MIDYSVSRNKRGGVGSGMGVGPTLSIGVGREVGVLFLLECLGAGLDHACQQGSRRGLEICYCWNGWVGGGWDFVPAGVHDALRL